MTNMFLIPSSTGSIRNSDPVKSLGQLAKSMLLSCFLHLQWHTFLKSGLCARVCIHSVCAYTPRENILATLATALP